MLSSTAYLHFEVPHYKFFTLKTHGTQPHICSYPFQHCKLLLPGRESIWKRPYVVNF